MTCLARLIRMFLLVLVLALCPALGFNQGDTGSNTNSCQ